MGIKGTKGYTPKDNALMVLCVSKLEVEDGVLKLSRVQLASYLNNNLVLSKVVNADKAGRLAKSLEIDFPRSNANGNENMERITALEHEVSQQELSIIELSKRVNSLENPNPLS